VFDFFAFSCAGQNLAARPIWCPRRERVTAPREAVATTIERTHRLYALVEELRVTAPRARSAGWLAERFAISVRTIQRDVLAMQVAGVPILVTPARRLHDRPRSPRPSSPSAAAR
jgi:hypothetical protein